MDWYLLALISAFFSATAAIFEKKILLTEKALPMTFILGIFNLILSIPFFFFIDYSALAASGIIVLLLKSVLGAAAFLCVMQAIKYLEISKALPMLVLTPGLVAFFAFIILGESLGLVEIGGIALLLAGTYVLQLGRRKDILGPAKSLFRGRGNYYILAALLIFTVTSILDKALLKNFKIPLNAFFGFQHLFFALIFLALAFIFSDMKNLKKTFQVSWKFIGALALITIVYRYSHLAAVKIAPVALVLSIKRMSVFFAVLIGGTYFKDCNLLRRVIATAMMVIGAILIILN